MTMHEYSYAEAVLADRFGDTWSVFDKAKTLVKFGRTLQAHTDVRTTVAEFQGSVANETFASANTVDSLVSSSASDTQVIVAEGHTRNLTTGELTFVVQEKQLDGQTPVTLNTPLNRLNRLYIKASTYPSVSASNVGIVYGYDSTLAGGVTAGVPNDATATKCLILAGLNQSEKCATAVSHGDAWIISGITGGVERQAPSGALADLSLEYREPGGVWRPATAEIDLSAAAQPTVSVDFRPFFIVPPNSDVRMIAISSANNTIIHGTIFGVLAKRTGLNGL